MFVPGTMLGTEEYEGWKEKFSPLLTFVFQTRGMYKTGVILGGSKELWYHSPLCLNTEKNLARGKVREKWFIRIGHLWGLQMDRWERLHPRTYWGCNFIIKGKAGRGRRTFFTFLSRHYASIISSSSRLSRGVFLSLHGQTRSTSYCFLCV